jgi:DeoR/GlpR family transcriptional regulator of sugar metabolism
MKRYDRMRKIHDFLNEHGNVSTVVLAKMLDISESSVRRDINYMISLEEYKNIERVHGGLILNRYRSDLEYMFELKLDLNRNLKLAVARAATKFIDDKDNIIIDSGTTCLYFAQSLQNKKGLRVITTDVRIAEELAKYSDIESNIIGGIVRPGYYTVGGINALDNLDRFSVNKVFMSVDAIDLEHGITNTTEFEVGVKRKIIKSAKRVYILTDHTKFGKHMLYRVSGISGIMTIITNKNLDPTTCDRFRKAGIDLTLV